MAKATVAAAVLIAGAQGQLECAHDRPSREPPQRAGASVEVHNLDSELLEHAQKRLLSGCLACTSIIVPCLNPPPARTMGRFLVLWLLPSLMPEL